MYYIGIDLGGTNIVVGIVTREGEIVKKTSVPTRAERPFSQIVADMAGCIEQLLTETGIDRAQIASIGIGSPGCMDTANGVLIFAGNFAYGTNVPLREEMNKYYSVPVRLCNDANAAALGEVIAGAAKGVKNAVLVTLGTGVGAGIILNRKIYEGQASAAGELGHTLFCYNGEECTCGRKGCWEAYASVTALVRQTKRAMQQHPESLMNRIGAERVNGKTAFDAARMGDPAAKEVVRQYTEYVAEGLVDTVNIFRPDVLLVGGGICKEGEYLLAPIRERLRKYTLGHDLLPEQTLAVAALGNDAGLIGAALCYA